MKAGKRIRTAVCAALITALAIPVPGFALADQMTGAARNSEEAVTADYANAEESSVKSGENRSENTASDADSGRAAADAEAAGSDKAAGRSEGSSEESSNSDKTAEGQMPAVSGRDSGGNESGDTDINGSSEDRRLSAEESPNPDEDGSEESGKVVPEPLPKKALSSFTISNPARLRTSAGNYYNLREYLGEGRYGYAIVEGSCTDGTYSYHCLINGTSDWGRLVKVRMSDGACVAVSNPYNFNHGNGMCYDSKRNRLVIVSYTYYRRTLSFVNPDNLNDITQQTIDFRDFKARLTARGNGGSQGISAISYNERYDCYIGMQKTDHNIFIIDAETLVVKAAAITKFESPLTGTFQSIDSDDSYVYFLISKSGGAGLIGVFDWREEKLAELLSGNGTEDIWMCGGGDGKASAVITLSGVNEIESMYHTDAGNGQSHFYLVNYNNDPKYKTVKYKVKWKKVRKKVKVKWKKVKKKVKWKKVKTKSGKWKWKYKKKKVWKYKKKTKKVWTYKTKTKQELSYYNRDSHIMDLGVF